MYLIIKNRARSKEVKEINWRGFQGLEFEFEGLQAKLSLTRIEPPHVSKASFLLFSSQSRLKYVQYVCAQPHQKTA